MYEVNKVSQYYLVLNLCSAISAYRYERENQQNGNELSQQSERSKKATRREPWHEIGHWRYDWRNQK